MLKNKKIVYVLMAIVLIISVLPINVIAATDGNGNIVFGDPKVKAILLGYTGGAYEVDTNHDNEISPTEAANWNGEGSGIMRMYNKGITSVEGLQYFTKIKRMELNENSIVDITPLSHLPNLEWLDLNDNNITTIPDFSANIKLKNLFIQRNIVLNTSGLAGVQSLEYIELSNNRISNVSFMRNLINLRTAWLGHNLIKDISSISDLVKNNAGKLSTLVLGDCPLNNAATPNAIHDISKDFIIQDPTYTNGIISRYEVWTIPTPDNTIINFPDINFKNALIANGVDLNGDNEISRDEALSVGYLNLYNKGISNLEGIQYFKNMSTLGLENNTIANIQPIEELTNLSALWLRNNQIKDISPIGRLVNYKGGKLSYLQISGNPLNSSSTSGAHLETSLTFRVPNQDITYEVWVVGTTTIPTPSETGDSIATVDGNNIIHFPDVKLKGALLRYGADRNNDGEVSVAEALAMTGTVDLSYRWITDISGIEYFTNLKSIKLNGNKIKYMNPLKNLTNLQSLDISKNQISRLPATLNMPSLKTLNLSGNAISDISAIGKLMRVDGGIITSLNLTGNIINNSSTTNAVHHPELDFTIGSTSYQVYIIQ